MSEFQSHAARSNLYRLPSTSRGDKKRQPQPTDLKPYASNKGSWKKLNKHSEGARSQYFDKTNKYSRGASSSAGYGHGNASIGHKQKLPPRKKMKKDSWTKAKQKIVSGGIPKKCLRPVLALIVVRRVISLRLVPNQSLPDY